MPRRRAASYLPDPLAKSVVPKSLPGKPARPSEKGVQADIIKTLVSLGYEVKFTGWFRKKVTCKGCDAAFYPEGAQGNEPGIPDLLVSRKGWGLPLWVGLEVKRDEKAAREEIRPEQKRLADEGFTVVVWTVAQAIDAMQEVEQRLGHDYERIARFWEMNPRWRFGEERDDGHRL